MLWMLVQPKSRLTYMDIQQLKDGTQGDLNLIINVSLALRSLNSTNFCYVK